MNSRIKSFLTFLGQKDLQFLLNFLRRCLENDDTRDALKRLDFLKKAAFEDKHLTAGWDFEFEALLATHRVETNFFKSQS
jgi:hypothetical protein